MIREACQWLRKDIKRRQVAREKRVLGSQWKTSTAVVSREGA